MIENPRLDTSSLLQKVQYRGKATNSQLQHPPQCMMNLWHVMRPPGRSYGQKNLYRIESGRQHRKTTKIILQQ